MVHSRGSISHATLPTTVCDLTNTPIPALPPGLTHCLGQILHGLQEVVCVKHSMVATLQAKVGGAGGGWGGLISG